MKKSTRPKKQTNLEAFRADPEVSEILEQQAARTGKSKSEIINEALRLNGHKAVLSLLMRDVKTAQDKLAAAQEYGGKGS